MWWLSIIGGSRIHQRVGVISCLFIGMLALLDLNLIDLYKKNLKYMINAESEGFY